MPRSFTFVVAAWALSLGFTGCSDDSPPPSDSSPGSPSASQTDGGSSIERTTPRGLAAAVLEHVDSETVTSTAGSLRGLSVLLATSSDAWETIYVDVTPARPRMDKCGRDSGFRTLSCTTEGTFAETMVRKSDNKEIPTLMGRVSEADRGSVLIQFWGTDSPEARDLLVELLADPHLGEQTTQALNTSGQDIADFEELETRSDVSVAP